MKKKAVFFLLSSIFLSWHGQVRAKSLDSEIDTPLSSSSGAQPTEQEKKEMWKAFDDDDIDKVKRLITANKLLVLAQDDGQKNTPLHAVTTVEDAKFMIDAGANLEAKTIPDYGALTPLIDHISDGRTDIALFLIEQGADVNAKALNDFTPIFYALSRDDPKVFSVVEALVKKGASVTQPNGGGKTPLMQAAESKKEGLKLTKFLLENGADKDVNTQNKLGATALHVAALIPNQDVAELLLKYGARLDLKCQVDKKSSVTYTPEDLAAKQRNTNMYFMLKDYGETKELTPKNNTYLFKLSKDVSKSSSKIQSYVDFIVGLGGFTERIKVQSESLEKGANVTAKWVTNFKLMDIHLEQAKEHATHWPVVYLDMRDCFNDLGRYGKDFTTKYGRAEDTFRVLRKGKTDEKEIEKKIAEKKEEWRDDGKFPSQIRRLSNRLRKKLEGAGSDYDKGLEEVRGFCDQTIIKAEIYEKSAEDMVTNFTKFTNNLEQDRTNFDNDKKDLSNINSEKNLTYQNEVMDKLDELEKRKVKVSEDIKKYSNKIKKTFDDNIQAAKTTAGITIATTLLPMITTGMDFMAKRFQNSANYHEKRINNENALNRRDRIKKKLTNVKAKITGGEKFDVDAKKLKPVDVDKKTRSVKWGNRGAKLASKVSTLASVAGFGVGIYSIVTTFQGIAKQEQDKANFEKQNQDFDKAQNEYAEVISKMMTLQLHATNIGILLKTKVQTLETLDSIDVRIKGAIEEGQRVAEYWGTMKSKLNEMMKSAEAGSKLTQKEEKKLHFHGLVDELEAMGKAWRIVKERAKSIEDLFQ